MDLNKASDILQTLIPGLSLYSDTTDSLSDTNNPALPADPGGQSELHQASPISNLVSAAQ